MEIQKQIKNMFGEEQDAIVPASPSLRSNFPSLWNSAETLPRQITNGITLLTADVWYSSDTHQIMCNTWFLSTVQMEYATIQVDLLQNGVTIGTNTLAQIKMDTMMLYVAADPQTPVTGKSELVIAVRVLNKEKDARLQNTADTVTVSRLLAFDEAIAQAKVDNPTNIHTPQGSTIHISFDRYSQLQWIVDYDYTSKRSPSSCQPIYLDMSGAIYLKDGYEYVDGSFQTDQVFLRKGAQFYVYNGGEATAVKIQDGSHHGFTWVYSNEWNTDFDKSVEGTNIICDLRIAALFRFRDTTMGREYTGMFIVSSCPYQEVAKKVKTSRSQPINYMEIPNLQFYWGCRKSTR